MNSLAISLHVPYHTVERRKDENCFSSKEAKVLWGKLQRPALYYIRAFIIYHWASSLSILTTETWLRTAILHSGLTEK